MSGKLKVFNRYIVEPWILLVLLQKKNVNILFSENVVIRQSSQSVPVWVQGVSDIWKTNLSTLE